MVASSEFGGNISVDHVSDTARQNFSFLVRHSVATQFSGT